MAVMSLRRGSNLGDAVRYVERGKSGSAERKEHEKNGTDRMAAVMMDTETLEEFIERGEGLAEANGRKVQMRSMVQSFRKEEFDPNNPSDVKYVNELGYAFGKELFPNSDVLSVTHVDGVGGHPHNHVFILNHDNETGKALTLSNMHDYLLHRHDKFLEERSLDVVERTASIDKYAVWEARREGNDLGKFDQELGDRIEEALLDKRSQDETSYRAVLGEKGIELIAKEHTIRRDNGDRKKGDVVVGWTYKMLDETGDKPRMRRRKASSLSTEFTRDGTKEIFEHNKQRSAVSATRTKKPTVTISDPEEISTIGRGHEVPSQDNDRSEDHGIEGQGQQPAVGAGARGAGDDAGDAGERARSGRGDEERSADAVETDDRDLGGDQDLEQLERRLAAQREARRNERARREADEAGERDRHNAERRAAGADRRRNLREEVGSRRAEDRTRDEREAGGLEL